MTFADIGEIKSLSAKIIIKSITGSDITNTVYSDAQARGDSRVMLETGVTSWESTDALYPSVKEAAEYFGAAFVLERYPGDKSDMDKSLMLYQKGLDICKSLANSSTQGLIIRAKPYKSYPLNPNASIYRSLPSGAGTASEDDTTLEG